MKRNLIQIITLCLCVVVVLITFWQNQRLNDYQNLLKNRIDNLSTEINNEIQGISNSIEQELEESFRSVAKYALEPKQIDKENQTLIADVSITLKKWHDDTKILLFAIIGDQSISISMDEENNGTFVGQLALPLENNYEIELTALISGGGMTIQETIGTWGDVFMLLPLQSSGGGWSGPDYNNGVLSSQFQISITGQDEKLEEIYNPTFKIFKNGKIEQNVTGVVDPYLTDTSCVNYTVDMKDYIWSMECDVGDVIEIHFCCEDTYGLGYDFLFATWVVQEATGDNQESVDVQSGEKSLTLYWP